MKRSVLALLLFLTTSIGHTKEGGNGGGVLVCGNRIELYDFYEGREPRGHNIKLWTLDSSLTFEDYIAKGLSHIKKDIPEVADQVEKMIGLILSTPADKLFADINIPEISDATINALGQGCHYEQAANWNEKFKQLFISKKLFNKLDNMNKAGLIFHEAIYKLSRETKVATENSDSVRQVVAKIFSDEKLNKEDSEVISSVGARIRATKPQCDFARQTFTEISTMTNKQADMVQNIAEYCFKYCLIPEEREFCRQTVEALK